MSYFEGEEAEDCVEILCDIKLEQTASRMGSASKVRHNTRMTFIPDEKCLFFDLAPNQIRLPLASKATSVVIHSNFMSEGKMCFRDVNRNLSLFVSNADPQELKYLKRAMQSALSGDVLPLRQQISPLQNRKRPCMEDGVANKRAKGVRPSSASLTEAQQSIVDSAVRGDSMFITGGAGTGKSMVLREIIRLLPPDTTFVTAPTGVAACNVSGMTIHEFAGIGKAFADESVGLEQLVGKLRNAVVGKRWVRAKTLIIDEISMLSGNSFDILNRAAQLFRNDSRVFGGLQVIACGDFFQLPPVSKSGRDEKLCFEACCWKKVIRRSYQLTQVFRQKDMRLIQLLEEIRWGRCSTESASVLRSRMRGVGEERKQERCEEEVMNEIAGERKEEDPNVLITRIMSHRSDVDRVNAQELEKLEGQVKTFAARDEGDERSLSFLNSQCLAPRQLHLKKGAQVMLVKTINRSAGLVNGARGLVKGFAPSGMPVVVFENGSQVTVGLEAWTCGDSMHKASRLQVPLQLAWAISIHKSQGITLAHLHVSLSKVFEPGMAYVALSRAKTLEGLRVLDFAPSAIRADPKVKEFYEKLTGRPEEGRSGEKSSQGGGEVRRLV